MKRNPILALLVLAALCALVACQNVKKEVARGKEAVKAVKKIDEATPKVAGNPLKNAQVGEYINYKMTSESMGAKTDVEMKQTVIAKDDVSVTLKTETTAMGMKMPAQETKIMLDRPYEPYKAGLTDAVVTPLGEGEETITVGDKSYACHWAKVKVTTATPTAMESVSTVWSCPDVPVNGMVKMVSESVIKAGGQEMRSKTTMELIGAGK